MFPYCATFISCNNPLKTWALFYPLSRQPYRSLRYLAFENYGLLLYILSFLFSNHMFFSFPTFYLFSGRNWLHFLFQDSYERAWCPGAFRSSMAGWEQHHWVSTPTHPFRPLLTVNTTWTPPSTPASCQWCSLA